MNLIKVRIIKNNTEFLKHLISIFLTYSKKDCIKNENFFILPCNIVNKRKKLLDCIEETPNLDVGSGLFWSSICAAKLYGFQIISNDNNKNKLQKHLMK